ncbi:MAG: biotin--[acetyl-CoA-carboxylase] ligase [Flavobacteriales bacterium]
MIFSERAIIRLESVDSTNNYAANLIRMSSAPDGTVITAQMQISGKGQRGTHWQSNAGENLLCSVVLYPTYISFSNHVYINKAVALALRDVVETMTDIPVFIKWPNDIMTANKKIAGILLEASWADQQMQHAIAGIGLNVNQTEFEIPNATSLRLLNQGESADIELCLTTFIVQLDKYMSMLKNGQMAEIKKLYRDHLFRLGQVSQFVKDGITFDGMITGVDDDGRLRLITSDGESLTCGIKEIQFVF